VIVTAFFNLKSSYRIITKNDGTSIEFGVYNPVTRTEHLASFKTTTPRTVTVCLDLNDNEVKFWLNDRRNSTKNIKLPEGGPWIPCVKITQEKNKLVLNPFAREPSDFYEKDFDKKFTLRKWLMPHLHNVVCVANMAPSQTQEETIKQFKSMKLSMSDIRRILFSHKTFTNEQPPKEGSP
jgi:hypothetical protein